MSGGCALPRRFALLAVSFFSAALAVAGNPLSLSAQQTAPPPSKTQAQDSGLLTFRKDVHRVILDVVVTDANEKPVRGLNRDDFVVAEDGKTQRVLSFDFHDFDRVPDVPKVPPLPANTFINVPSAPQRGPLYVILYDMVNMKLDDQATARTQLLRFISEKPAGARFAIFVLSDGLRMVQGFTDDQAELLAALDPKRPRAHVPKIFLYGENFGQGDIRLIRWAFTEIAHFLDALPGRKNVIWFTGSMASTFLPGVDPNTGEKTEALSFNDDVKEAINAMARSQVSVYPVDVRGVIVTHMQANPGAVASSDSGPVYASYATEEDIATATGGHAFYSTNDLKEALTQATEIGGCYYTLTYSPSNQNYDGQLRRMQVELTRRGYHLAYRRAYYAYNPDLPKQQRGKGAKPAQPPAPRDSLFANMQHGAPLTNQLLFKAHIRPVGSPARATPEQMAELVSGQPEYFRARNNNHPRKALLPVELQTYAIDYIVVVERPKAPRAQPFVMEVAAAAFDGDGVLLNGSVENAAESLSSAPEEGLQAVTESQPDSAPQSSSTPHQESGPHVFHRAQQLFDVPANAKSIRLAVHDVTTDRVGAMEVPLPLAREPETQADAPLEPGQATSPEAATPKPN
jgi:VWFA-related protein